MGSCEAITGSARCGRIYVQKELHADPEENEGPERGGRAPAATLISHRSAARAQETQPARLRVRSGLKLT